MKYTYMPAENLVRVEFLAEIPYDAGAVAPFFAGRTALLSPVSGAWMGVVCSMDEWSHYVNFVIAGLELADVPSPKALQSLRKDRDDFIVFRAAVESGPFFRPRPITD